MKANGRRGREAAGTRWDLLPAVILFLALGLVVALLPGTSRVGAALLVVGLGGALGVALGKIGIGSR